MTSPFRRFAHRTVIVTGAGSAIGRATAELFAAEGAAVVVNDLDADAADRTVDSIRQADGEAIAAPFDIADGTGVERAVADVVDRYGRIDVLVNNAAVTGRGPAETNTGYFRNLEVNLGGTYNCARAVANASMLPRAGGSIVNVASGAGLQAIPDDVGYSTSKHGVVGLTKALALEWASRGITVNAICPGITDGAMVRAIADVDPEYLPKRFARIPMGRPADPTDHANAIVFLASDEARYITGIVLPVDGGQLALHSGQTL